MNIRTSPANLLSVEELVLANAYLGLLAERVHELGHDVPSALKNELNEVEVELNRKTCADKQKRLEILRLKEEGYLSRDEKLAKTRTEREQLEVELGVRPAKSSTKTAGRK